MGRWTDLATWRGPTVNQGGKMSEQRGVVVHIAEGSFEGTIAWQRNPAADVSSHFVVARDGRIAQMVDTDVTAWTQRVGNGHWLSIENEGHTPSPLSAAQVQANAKILARWHEVYGGPLQLATSPAGRGLGHHSMGAESGVNWGHSDCPGPAIKAQKSAIVARAIEISTGEDDDMTPGESQQLAATAWRLDTLREGRDTVEGGPTAGETMWIVGAVKAIANAVGQVDDQVAAKLKSDFDALDAAVAASRVEIADVDEQVVERLGAADLTAAQKADLLRPVLGDDAAAVGALLQS